jgi:UDP-glucuronate decarboxylase
MAVNDGRVVSNFIVNALRNQDLVINGDGFQTRSFCYIDDTINGLVKLMNSQLTGPINIGNPNEITVSELASTIIRLTNSNSRISYSDKLLDDPSRRCPDISLASNLLDWSPVTNLISGLQSTINYFESILNSE